MFLSLFTPFFFFHFSFSIFLLFPNRFFVSFVGAPYRLCRYGRFFCWRSLSALPIRSLFARLLPAGNTPRDALLRKRNTGFCWRSLSALPIRSLFARLLPAGNTPRDALLRKRNTGFWVRYAGAYAHPSAVAHAATALRQRRSEISARVYDSHHPRYATPPIWRIERYAQWR